MQSGMRSRVSMKCLASADLLLHELVREVVGVSCHARNLGNMALRIRDIRSIRGREAIPGGVLVCTVETVGDGSRRRILRTYFWR